MDISGINDKINNATVQNAKNKVGDDSFEKRLKSALDNKDEKELKKVCRDFEGILLNMMYKEMKASIPKSDLAPEDSGKEIFEGMMDDKLVEEASKSGRMGLGEMLYKQLSRQLKSTYKLSDDK